MRQNEMTKKKNTKVSSIGKATAERLVQKVRENLAAHVQREMLRRYPFDGQKIRSPTAQRIKLEEDSGVGRTTILEILSRKRGTSIDNVARLAACFGREPYELLLDPDDSVAD